MNRMMFDSQRKLLSDNSTTGLFGSSSSTTSGNAADDARLALFQSLAADSQAQSLLRSNTNNFNFGSALEAHSSTNNRNLTPFTNQDAAQRSAIEAVLGRNNNPISIDQDEEITDTKRKLLLLQAQHASHELDQLQQQPNFKKQRRSFTEGTTPSSANEESSTSSITAAKSDPIRPSEKGVASYVDSDVLCGRGGGTNVHPGNRHFRELINLHRRAYLKARKNDKPSISRAIVRAVRENNGRFLKRDEKSGLWLEIGDDAAREKTSQGEYVLLYFVI